MGFAVCDSLQCCIPEETARNHTPEGGAKACDISCVLVRCDTGPCFLVTCSALYGGSQRKMSDRPAVSFACRATTQPLVAHGLMQLRSIGFLACLMAVRRPEHTVAESEIERQKGAAVRIANVLSKSGSAADVGSR